MKTYDVIVSVNPYVTDKVRADYFEIVDGRVEFLKDEGSVKADTLLASFNQWAYVTGGTDETTNLEKNS